MTSPTLISDELRKKGKNVKPNAITKMISRLGIDRKAIDEKVKIERQKDILDHQRVKDYITAASTSGITRNQRDSQIKHIQQMFEWMGRSQPEGWTYNSVIECLKQHYEHGEDERGRLKFKKEGAIQDYLSAINTMFPLILPKGWSAGLGRKAGELKDNFSFEEFNAFINALEDTQQMSLLGWRALFKEQANMGAREGTRESTGILSLEWDNINYQTRRCSLREKGGKGDAARLWKNLPLDFFPWLHGWDDLVSYHVQQFGYEPTNECHAKGRCFSIDYDDLREQFHATRKATGLRIANDLETMKPHVLRKTHAQWLIKLRVPLERICGQFPSGRFGVGWDNPLNLLKYYVTLESDEEVEIMQKAQSRMLALGLVAPLVAWEKDILGVEYAFSPRIEESHIPLAPQP